MLPNIALPSLKAWTQLYSCSRRKVFTLGPFWYWNHWKTILQRMPWGLVKPCINHINTYKIHFRQLTLKFLFVGIMLKLFKNENLYIANKCSYLCCFLSSYQTKSPLALTGFLRGSFETSVNKTDWPSVLRSAFHAIVLHLIYLFSNAKS